MDGEVLGANWVEELEQNAAAVKVFHKLSQKEQSMILERTKKGPAGNRVKNYDKRETGGALPAIHDGDRPS